MNKLHIVAAFMSRTFRGAIVTFLVTIAAHAVAQEIPAPLGYVSDFAGVIGSADEARIESVAVALKRATGAEIAVATFASLEGYGSIEQMSLAVANGWGVGEEDKDNGVLIIVAVAERRLRIEVGYGLVGAIPDGLAGRIRDNSLVPHLRNDDYGTGFLRTTEAIAGIIAKEYGVEIGTVSLAEADRYNQPVRSSSPQIDESELIGTWKVILYGAYDAIELTRVPISASQMAMAVFSISFESDGFGAIEGGNEFSWSFGDNQLVIVEFNMRSSDVGHMRSSSGRLAPHRDEHTFLVLMNTNETGAAYPVGSIFTMTRVSETDE